jgi:hypothetical protein
MSDNFALALQKGIGALLAADAGVTALVGQRIYDEPPSTADFPYVRFGEISPSAADTDSTEGAEVQIGLQVHSRPVAGRTEAVRVVEAVKAAMHRQEASVTVTGFNLVELIFQTYAAQRDPDGRGYTATISFRATVENA